MVTVLVSTPTCMAFCPRGAWRPLGPSGGRVGPMAAGPSASSHGVFGACPWPGSRSS